MFDPFCIWSTNYVPGKYSCVDYADMVSALLLMNGHGVSVVVDERTWCERHRWLRGHGVRVIVDYTDNNYNAGIDGKFWTPLNGFKRTISPNKKLGSVYISNCNILLIGGYLRAKLRVRGQANLEICNKISLRKRKRLWNCFSLFIKGPGKMF